MKALYFIIVLGLSNCVYGQPIEKYKLLTLHTLNAESYENISVQATAVQMPNGQKLFVAYTGNAMPLSVKKRQDLNIPGKAIFAISSKTNEAKNYYVLSDEETYSIYEIGNNKEHKEILRYICIEDYWLLEPKANDLEGYLTQRNKYWHPNEGQYYFSEQYVYNFTEANQTRSFSFYYDPITGTVLLRKGDSFEDEMIDYIIVRPEKDYIMVFTDEFGRQKYKLIPKADFYPKITSEIQENYLVKHFELKELNAKLTGTQKAVCIQDMFGYDYNFKHETKAKSVLSLAFVTHNFSNLNLIANSGAMPEDGLLIPLFNDILPGYLLPVKNVSLDKNNKLNASLECIMATDFHVKLPGLKN